MAEKAREKARQKRKVEAHITGFCLPVAPAKAVKVEAALRQILLNKLFAETWEIYGQHLRAG